MYTIIKLWKRFWFYKSPLGRKILASYKHLKQNSLSRVCYNYSVDPSKYISYLDIQWSIAHRLFIEEDEQNNYLFLNYVRKPFYINNPNVRADNN